MPQVVVRGRRAVFPPQSADVLACYAVRLKAAPAERIDREADRILFRLCWWGGTWWSRFLLSPALRRLTRAERELVARQAVGLLPVPASPPPVPSGPPPPVFDLKFAAHLHRRDSQIPPRRFRG